MTGTARRIGFLAVAAVAVALASPGARADDADVGKAAPPFTLRDLDNRPLALSDLSYPGPEKSYKPKKVVLLDFFRTDCPPCKKKLPDVVALHQRLKDRGFTAVLVALVEEGDGDTKLTAYLAAHPVPFPVVVDRHEYAAKKYIPVEGGGLSIGTMVLVDRDGTVRAKSQDEREIEKALEGLLPGIAADGR
jgi:peroxiredoxin